MDIYRSLVVVHVIAGTIALITFWIAGLSKKGSPLHKRVGKVYLLAMCGILITGFPMSVYAWIYFSKVVASFLAYLLIITGTAMWTSWRAIKDKRDVNAFKGPTYRLLLILNALSGLSMVYVGLVLAKQMQFIISAFSLVGIIAAVQGWRFLRKPAHEPNWWMREHIGGMMGNAVATHIAFFSIGLPRILPMLSGPVQQILAWLLPLALSVVATMYFERKYLRPRAAIKPVT